MARTRTPLVHSLFSWNLGSPKLSMPLRVMATHEPVQSNPAHSNLRIEKIASICDDVSFLFWLLNNFFSLSLGWLGFDQKALLDSRSCECRQELLCKWASQVCFPPVLSFSSPESAEPQAQGVIARPKKAIYVLSQHGDDLITFWKGERRSWKAAERS